MWLKAKILPKYMDEVKKGRKAEFRQIEGIILNDGERELVLAVSKIDTVPSSMLSLVKEKFGEVEWNDQIPTVVIELGKPIKKTD